MRSSKERTSKIKRKGTVFRRSLFALIVSFALMLGGLQMNTLKTAAAGEYTDTSEYPSLCEIYADDFRIGVAVQAIDHWNDRTAEIGNPAKEELICKSFNSMTFGNELKPAYNFSSSSPTLFKVDPAAEELLTFAKENGIPVRGHVLVWHSQVEPGFFAKDFKALSNGKVTHNEKDELDEDCLVDRKTLLERLKTYIYGAMEYVYQNGFADMVYAWDVVNEAVDESKPDGLRQSYWYKIIGPEFLYYSFLYAREAELTYAKEYAADYGLDPSGDLSPILPELFYNDYNEWFGTRCDITIRFLTEDAYNPGQSMVKSFAIKEGGDGTIFGDGLVDGIGMQGHLDDTQNIKTYIKALEKYDSAVGNVHITELDVGKGSGTNADYNQAKFYYDFFKALLEEKDKGVNLNCVTFWGLTDDASWRRGANPLLFNKDLSCKKAFDAVVMAGRREEFTLSDSPLQENLSEWKMDFEPYDDGGKKVAWTPETTGFVSRGSGHQSELSMVMNENHTPDVKGGFALKVSRNEKDASVKIDLSGFIGKAVRVEGYMKSADAALYMGIEGNESVLLSEEASTGDWVLLSGSFLIPEDWTGAALYFETDGNADFFIDDIAVTVIDEKDVQGKEDAGADVSDLGKEDESPAAADQSAANAGQDITDESPSGKSGSPLIWLLPVGAVLLAVAAFFFAKKRGKKPPVE